MQYTNLLVNVEDFRIDDPVGNSLPKKTDTLKEIYREIDSINYEDGIVFDNGTISAEEIKIF